MKEQAINKKNFSFQRSVAIIGVLLFIGKLITWQITASDAVFSDAMESIVNIVAAFMGLYSLYVASKPMDKDHPYGHGKIEFITSGIEGTLIIFAGVVIIIQAVSSFIAKNTLHQLDWGILIIALTAVINYLMGYISYQKGVRENSLVLQSSGKHLQSDTLTTIGVVLSLVVVHFTQFYWIDALVAGIFGGYIIITGYKIIRESMKGIMDEADTKIITDIAEFLNEHRKPEWIDVHNMKIQQFGSHLHIDAHLTLPWYFELRQAHNEMEELIISIAENTDREIEFNFHMDDCKPSSCEVCQIMDCPVRKLPFVKKIDWTVETITQTGKHKL